MDSKKVASIAMVGTVCVVIVAGVATCVLAVEKGLEKTIEVVAGKCCSTVVDLVADILDA